MPCRARHLKGDEVRERRSVRTGRRSQGPVNGIQRAPCRPLNIRQRALDDRRLLAHGVGDVVEPRLDGDVDRRRVERCAVASSDA
jgi:hypothetical protein